MSKDLIDRLTKLFIEQMKQDVDVELAKEIEENPDNYPDGVYRMKDDNKLQECKIVFDDIAGLLIFDVEDKAVYSTHGLAFLKDTTNHLIVFGEENNKD